MFPLPNALSATALLASSLTLLSPHGSFAATPSAKHWAYQPERAMQPPADASWSSHPIDRFIFAELKKRGLKPNPPANPRTLVRRLHFDCSASTTSASPTATPAATSADRRVLQRGAGRDGVVGLRVPVRLERRALLGRDRQTPQSRAMLGAPPTSRSPSAARLRRCGGRRASPCRMRSRARGGRVARRDARASTPRA